LAPRDLRKHWIWGAPVIALCTGLALGHGVPWRPFSAARADSTDLAPMQRLLAEDEIRNKIAAYGLYADGDGSGGHPRDLAAMAQTMMAPDVVTELYRATGGPPIVYKGRDFIARTPPENKVVGVAGRHYLVSTVFDDVSATAAHTRTAAAYFDASKNMIGADCKKAGEGACGGKPLRTVMWVYHMTWTKTPQGWMIARNVLRDDN
jgi:hypothetical protein